MRRFCPFIFALIFYAAFPFFAAAQTFNVVIQAFPASGGSVIVNSTTYSTYPSIAQFANGTVLNFSAVANTGFAFLSWHSVLHLPQPNDNANPMQFTVVQNDTVYAFFNQPAIVPDTFDVVLNAIPANGGSITLNSTPYTNLPATVREVENAPLTFTAMPDAGFKFLKWQTISNTPLPDDSTNPMQFNISNHDSVYAIFEELPTLNILVNVVPPLSGHVDVNGFTPPTYPYKVKLVLDSNVVFSAAGDTIDGTLGTYAYVFDHYEFSNHVPNPDNTSPVVFINFKQSDTVTAYFNKVPLPPQDSTLKFFMPNAFTPNGINKDFMAWHGSEPLDKFNIQIFNRWGQKVYESDESLFKWNGQFNGKECPIGVYSYFLTGERLGSRAKVKMSGVVTLIR